MRYIYANDNCETNNIFSFRTLVQVKRQRHQSKLLQDGKKSTLIPSRVKELEDEGFVWDSHSALWEERLHELEDYRQSHCHCNVPSNFPTNPKLSTWVKCQRRQYRLHLDGGSNRNKNTASSSSSNLTKARILALNNLGFQWDGRGVAGNTQKIAS